MRAKVYKLVKPRVGWLSALSGLSFTAAGFYAHPIAGLITLGMVLLIAEWRVS